MIYIIVAVLLIIAMIGLALRRATGAIDDKYIPGWRAKR